MLCTLPVSVESRSAFFRMLCNIEDSASASASDSDGVELTASSVPYIISSILRSLHLSSLSVAQLQLKLKQPLRPSYLQLLCESEFERIKREDGSLVVCSLPIDDSSSSSLLPTTPAAEASTALEEVLKAVDSTKTLGLDVPTTVGEHKLVQLVLGVFSSFLLVDRRDVAAVIAVVLLRRVDIGCLCLKPTGLTHDESLRLLEFCLGIPLKAELAAIEGTEALSHELLKAVASNPTSAVSTEFTNLVCNICGFGSVSDIATATDGVS